jgi:hypothetical protein
MLGDKDRRWQGMSESRKKLGESLRPARTASDDDGFRGKPLG